MQQTPNFALKKIELTDSPPDITVINSNWDTIDKELKELTSQSSDETSHVYYADDTGTANAKMVTLAQISDYKKGMGVSFTNKTQNTGAVTINVNGLGTKPILKSNGNALASGNLKANSVYTVRYNGTSFILQGEGGEYGDVTAGDVISGVKFGTEAGLATGTLALTGSATPAQVLSGFSFYNTDPKAKPTGTMPNYANTDIAVAFYDKIKSLIPHPQDSGGQGLLTVENGNGITGFINSGTTFNMNIMGLVPSNIREGVKIGRFGGTGNQVMVGTASVASMGGRRSASGTVWVSKAGGPVTVTGLGFTPGIIYMWQNVGFLYASRLGNMTPLFTTGSNNSGADYAANNSGIVYTADGFYTQTFSPFTTTAPINYIIVE